MQAKSKTEQCQWQCAFKYHSSARKRERECYHYACVQFSVGLSAYTYLGAHSMFLYVYVFTKGCIFVSLSVCAGGEWGSVVCLCVEGPGCSPDLAGNCNGACPVQKTARASHLQAKWPYSEDINLHLGQQQHEQQGDETGYPHVHRAWLSIRTGSTWFFMFISVLSFFR